MSKTVNVPIVLRAIPVTEWLQNLVKLVLMLQKEVVFVRHVLQEHTKAKLHKLLVQLQQTAKLQLDWEILKRLHAKKINIQTKHMMRVCPAQQERILQKELQNVHLLVLRVICL